jgi:uncharacterized protein (TIGR03437 family)
MAAATPVLTYSTYLRDAFSPKAIAVDPSGNVYLAGSAVIDPAGSTTAAMVVKLNAQAGQYAYVSFLNGQTNQVVNAIAVDAAGNAYAAGSYLNAQGASQAFVAKLDANGDLVFSTPLGGMAAGTAQAVAVNGAGQIVISGTSFTSGFPSTAGAYSVANSANHPWLVELNGAGTQTVFSATGIGGSAMALDSAGNIYVAGTTMQLDYPTTSGVYQPVFPAFTVCTSFLCQIGAQGANQYVSKIDPTGSKLMFSTALTGNQTGTTNGGLAVDAQGNVYLTGFAGAGYPYTVTVPAIPGLPGGSTATFSALPYVSKLDPMGRQLLFSVPAGGAGVQVDSSGMVYVGGSVGSSIAGNYAVTASLPALAAVPAACLPNGLTGLNASYVSQIDGSSGSVVGTQYLGGSTLTISGAAFSGTSLWITGPTADTKVPFTPNVLTLPYFEVNLQAGAYLGAVDFSQTPPAGTPQIGCVVDSSNFAPSGQAARYQLLTVLGSGLGPAAGVTAADSATTTLGGVQVTFGGVAAPLLYASSTQINLAVPLLPFSRQFSPMQVSVGGSGAAPRAFPLTDFNPNLFLNVPMSIPVTNNSPGYVALALNADGSLNGPANPAELGSAMSVFVNGMVPDPDVISGALQLLAEGWTVTGLNQLTPFVQEVGLQVPSALGSANYFSCPPAQAPVCTLGFSLYYGVGTLNLAPVGSGQAGSAVVYVSR